MCSQGMYEHYEPRFWGLDPVFCTRVKLNIGDVMSLQSHPNFPGKIPGTPLQYFVIATLTYLFMV